jgi:sigma-B regulation protein RsbU (phosphoserine phosphatase)
VGGASFVTTTIDTIIPDDEAGRLRAVRRYDILDTPPDGSFDRITSLAARLFQVPIAIVSIVDTDRIWFKSHHGLADVTQIDRAPGLCASAILQYEPWVVSDAATDLRTLTNPLVAGDFGLRFYAGVPLTTRDGHNLGTLCVIDRKPREVTADEIENLVDLAGLVTDELELRLQARRTVDREERLRRNAEELAGALQASLLPPRPPVVPGMDVATRYLAGERGLDVGGDFFDVFRLASNDWGIVLGDVCGRGARPATLAMLARWAIRAASVHEASPSDVLRDVNAVFVGDELPEEDDRYCSAVFARLELDTCGAWLTVANAGHPLPILVRRSGTVELRTDPTLPIGLFDTIDPIDDRVGLGPGDALVFYTDGITEARNLDGELYGDDRLIAELRGLTGCPADVIADSIINSARRFTDGPHSDDVAVLVVGYPQDR